MDPNHLQAFVSKADSVYSFREFVTREHLGQWLLGTDKGIPHVGREIFIRGRGSMRVLCQEVISEYVTVCYLVGSKQYREYHISHSKFAFDGANFGKTFLQGDTNGIQSRQE
jgi:hypothetical protein